MKNVRTVIWDLDETVWFYKENEPQVLCEKLNIDEVETFEKQYYEMWASLNEYFKDGVVTNEGIEIFISEKISMLKEYDVSVEDLMKAIRDEKFKFITLNNEAAEIMKYFYEKGIKNISITDWIAQHQKDALKRANLHLYIQEVYGCDNSYLKCTNKRAEVVLKELIKDKPNQFLMIGDSLSSDIFFANSIGIKSIWYNRKGKVNTTDNIPTLEVKSLLELKEIL